MTAQDFLCKAKVGVTNDLSGRQKLRIADGVIAVRMRVDDVPTGLSVSDFTLATISS